VADEKKSFIRQLLSKEIPGVRRAKDYVDERLTKRIVEPLAQKGYEDVGAAIATIPSTAAEFLLPDTVGDAALMSVPAAGKAAGKVAKAAKAAQEAKLANRVVKAGEEELRGIDRTIKQMDVDVTERAQEIKKEYDKVRPKNKAEMSMQTAMKWAKEELGISPTVLKDIRIPSNLKPVE
jgi:hypothetical protein